MMKLILKGMFLFPVCVRLAFAAANIPEINVKIGSQIERLKVTSDKDFDFYFLRGDHKHKSTQKKLEFDCNFNISSKNKTVLFASLKATASRQDLFFKDKGFGGHLKLATSTTRGCDLIQSIKMNNYLESLLSKEMNGSWPIEALKAQAVAARSYAMDKISKATEGNYHIISGEIHQVSGSSEDITKKTIQAVMKTRGEVLVNNEENLVPGFYHAECGGRTFDPIDVWSGYMFDYSPTECPYCHEKSKIKNWNKKITAQKFQKFIKSYFGKDIDLIESVKILDPYKIHLQINNKNYIFLPSDFRKSLLSLGIQSNNFKIDKFENGIFYITGSGRGHGVGMCQLGALKMAELGHDYKEILNFYYPKLKLKKVY